ncbi:hypothetical protein RN001_001448 [Aquatica leii]|uniref:Uncharacterized protein n=1 Tax=Aquatica leii TaxID=1421715 RepID=A0AAN7PG11_9COLE|nr:hypothetical protein RN001_001448 [Aquatica leii]
MVVNHWNNEISSLATKDLAEKKWNKPVTLPLTKDVMKFRNYVTKVAMDNFELLKKQNSDEQAFKKLVEASLCLTILFNRRRIGDVQITQDVYQTAKVSKLLSLFDKGKGAQYKGQSLSEIDVVPSSESEPEYEENRDEVMVEDSNLNCNENKNFECSEDLSSVDIIGPLSSRPREMPKKGNRVRWTVKQKQVVEKHFKKHIMSKTVPKKEECLYLIEANKDLFYNLDWVRVKTYVYNKYKNV